jgi:hypothetical protein
MDLKWVDKKKKKPCRDTKKICYLRNIEPKIFGDNFDYRFVRFLSEFSLISFSDSGQGLLGQLRQHLLGLKKRRH